MEKGLNHFKPKVLDCYENPYLKISFKNLEKMRFLHTLTYENCCNSLNFLDTGLIFWI